MIHPAAYHMENWRAYTSVKVEFATGRHDAGGGEPYYAVIDHHRVDNIPNLWTLIPGKFTLAFHASRSVAENLLVEDEDMSLSGVSSSCDHQDVESFVAHPTWALPAESSGPGSIGYPEV